MAGIGRLQNKIAADLEKKEVETPPVSRSEAPSTPSPRESSPAPEKPTIKKTVPPVAPQTPSPQRKVPLKQIPRINIELKPTQNIEHQPENPSLTSSPNKKRAAAKDKLYQQILADSLKERLERQKFIDQVEGRAQGKPAASPTTAIPAHKVVFQPVPQTPSQLQKILVRILIVLLIASLGLLAYLMLKGYLI